jgi:hypothetical protein
MNIPSRPESSGTELPSLADLSVAALLNLEYGRGWLISRLYLPTMPAAWKPVTSAHPNPGGGGAITPIDGSWIAVKDVIKSGEIIVFSRSVDLPSAAGEWESENVAASTWHLCKFCD